jgi:hypothetical protein
MTLARRARSRPRRWWALDEMPMPETPKRCHTFFGAVGFFRGFMHIAQDHLRGCSTSWALRSQSTRASSALATGALCSTSSGC